MTARGRWWSAPPTGGRDQGDAGDRGRSQRVSLEGAAEPGHAADGGQDQGRALFDAGVARGGAADGARSVRRHREHRHRGIVTGGGSGRFCRTERGRRRRYPHESGAHQVRGDGAGASAISAQLPAARRARGHRARSVRPHYHGSAVRRSRASGDAGTGRRVATGTIWHDIGDWTFAKGCDTAANCRSLGAPPGAVPWR